MVIVNELNQAQQAGQRSDAAEDSDPAKSSCVASDLPPTHTHTHSQSISHTLTHTGTRAKMPLFHPSPTIQPAVIPSPPPQPVSFSHSRITLCFFPDGGGEGGAQPRSCHGALILRHLLFFFIFLGFFFSRSFSLKMYSVVFFFLFCFFEEKYYCSSLPSVCNLLIIPRLSDADHSVVVGGDDWHEHSKHAIKCWLFRPFLPSLSLCLSEWGLLFFLLQRMQLNSQELKCRIQHRELARDWFSHNNVSHCIKWESFFFTDTHSWNISPLQFLLPSVPLSSLLRPAGQSHTDPVCVVCCRTLIPA